MTPEIPLNGKKYRDKNTGIVFSWAGDEKPTKGQVKEIVSQKHQNAVKNIQDAQNKPLTINGDNPDSLTNKVMRSEPVEKGLNALNQFESSPYFPNLHNFERTTEGIHRLITGEPLSEEKAKQILSPSIDPTYYQQRHTAQVHTLDKGYKPPTVLGSPDLSNKIQGINEAVSGGLGLASPLAIPEAITAPVAVGTSLLTGVAAQTGVDHLLKIADPNNKIIPTEIKELISNLVGVGAGTKAHEFAKGKLNTTPSVKSPGIQAPKESIPSIAEQAKASELVPNVEAIKRRQFWMSDPEPRVNSIQNPQESWAPLKKEALPKIEDFNKNNKLIEDQEKTPKVLSPETPEKQITEEVSKPKKRSRAKIKKVVKDKPLESDTYNVKPIEESQPDTKLTKINSPKIQDPNLKPVKIPTSSDRFLADAKDDPNEVESKISEPQPELKAPEHETLMQQKSKAFDRYYDALDKGNLEEVSTHAKSAGLKSHMIEDDLRANGVDEAKIDEIIKKTYPNELDDIEEPDIEEC